MKKVLLKIWALIFYPILSEAVENTDTKFDDHALAITNELIHSDAPWSIICEYYADFIRPEILPRIRDTKSPWDDYTLEMVDKIMSYEEEKK
jgi:hypothetical protein